MRDLGAVLALPALWVDDEPLDIARSLLGVLLSVLDLETAYARFDDEGGPPLETWRPPGAAMPRHLQQTVPHDPAAGLDTWTVPPIGPDAGTPVRVSSLRVALPQQTGLVVVSAARGDFPTDEETHLLRLATGQAAVAIRAARRLAGMASARSSAEDALSRQNDLLRALVGDIDPSLRSIAHQVHEAARLIAEVDDVGAKRAQASLQEPAVPVPPGSGDESAQRLTRRELQVLGLLAQGLSNKEIAGVMWLSHRTVERHVTSLYRRIGVSRRSEATAFALRHGLA